jgi:hypothetical protein
VPKHEAFDNSLSHAWVFRKKFLETKSACLNHSSLFEVNKRGPAPYPPLSVGYVLWTGGHSKVPQCEGRLPTENRWHGV